MYLLGHAGGIAGQRELWSLVDTNRLILADLSTEEVERSAQLMDKYADRPMDLADATLVALAEEQGHRKVFSLNSDFHIYRISGRQRFVVAPRR